MTNGNKKAIIGVVAVMAVLLIVLSFFLFKQEPVDPQPTDPIMQNPSSSASVAPTTQATLPPTVAPTTQPQKPHGGVVTVDKSFYNKKETVNFSCVTLGGMSTLRVYLPDGTEKTYTDVGASVTMTVTAAGSYSAILETVTNEGVVYSDTVHFVVGAVPTTPTTKKPTTKPTTVAPTTVAPTTVAPTTVAPTTVAPTTVKPTTVAPTTVKPTTVAPTTVAPTTVKPTTVAPTTVAPTTVKPTTAAPTTAKPTTKPTTAAPTTVKPTTKPTTAAPTTVKPTTAAPTTVKPTVNMNGTFYITQNGAAKATVVFSENYTEKTYKALVDLLDYIERISGATLDYMMDNEPLEQDRFYILLGPTRFHSELGIEIPKGYPNNEKLIVKRQGNVLALIGNDDGAFTGTQYAVTRFLEELGCGWFGTQDLWNVVPSNKTITIEQMNIVETPKFIARGKNRLNSSSTAELAQRWYMGGVETLVGQHFLMSYVGNSYQTANPNWYARNSNGTQMFPLGSQSSWPHDGYWQFCYSDAGLRNKVAEVVKNYFKNNPNCYVFSITPNDGWEFGVCQCATCKTYDYGHSNNIDTILIIDFANAVAKIVAEEYPDRYVSFLTYHSTLAEPFGQNRAVHKNVEIMFCMETSMTQPASQVNYIGMSGSITNISWRQNFLNYISKTGVQQRSVWKWLCIAANGDINNWQYIPWVQGNVATDDHTFWKNNGVKYVFYDQGPLGGYKEYENSLPLRWPLWYVANRGCWTQNKTGMQLLEDACKKLYGNGWDEMLAYYQALADASAACTAKSHAWANPPASSVYTSAHISTIDAKVNAAKAVYGQVTAVQKQRMENQLGLWATAKTKI